MHLRRPQWVLALLAVATGGCSCDEDPLTPTTPGTCEPAFQCPVGFEYRDGECRTARCQIDADCCPGQKCNAAAGFCADQYVACTDDSQCTEVPGRSCIDFRGGRFCGYPNLGNAVSESGTQTCVTSADCDRGRTCFGSRCVVYAPCEGGCPDGQVCDIDSNTCHEVTACTETCAEGQMLVVGDPDRSSGPRCCKIECRCATLPPVLPGQYGWYAALAVTDDDLVVSAYDAIYGDLVVVQFAPDGTKKRVDYVDGFPTTGPIVANPDGPRGGRDQLGPRVGEHTSIAVDSAHVAHVAYYDRSEGTLRYAHNAGGSWKVSVVDDDGNVGMYTSIAIAADGHPHIAYMMVEGTIAPDPMKRSGLKYASGRTPLPASAADWSIQVVDTRLVPPPVCGGGCASSEACIDSGGGPTCVATVSGCMPTCDASEACIDRGGRQICEAKVQLLPIDDLPEGTGLFASLAFTSTGTPYIAYYDRIERDLRVAVGAPNGSFRAVTLDGSSTMSPMDAGQHASLAIGPNDLIGIAYFDATNDDLVYMDVRSRTREVADRGVAPPDLSLVGADASLIFDEQGRPSIAYQDPTHIDLLYARRSGNPPLWSTEVLRGAPARGAAEGTASGFYASQRRRGSTAFISNVDVSFDPEGNLLLDLNVIVKELF